jgi:chaperonin cofactor prefoldin
MALVKRIAGGVMFVVALITCLLCVVGMFSIWNAKFTVDATAFALIDIVTDYLDLTIQTIDTLDSNVAAVEQTLRDLQTNRPVTQRMQQVVTDELQPALEQLTTRAQGLRERGERLNQQIEQLNRMPFVEIPTLTGVLASLEEPIDTARTQVQTMRTAIETRNQERLQAASASLEQSLGQVRTILTEGGAVAGSIEKVLLNLREVLTFWSTVSTSAISALLAVLAGGQISLGVHAWGWMRGQRSMVPVADAVTPAADA